MTMKNVLISFTTLLLILSCSSDDDNMQEVESIDLLVINEGNFQSGDGTISTYDRNKEEIVLNAYEARNDFQLAATLQNAAVIEDRIYLVTNAPDKLEIISTRDLASVAVIDEGLSNPYSFAADDDLGIITNWGDLNFETFTYENSFLALVDLNENSITGTIPMDVQPQDVKVVNSKIYITENGNFLTPGTAVKVFQKNGNSISLLKSIEVGNRPDRMVVDQNNDIWIIHNDGAGIMTVIDTDNDVVTKTIEGLLITGFNEKMVINETGDKIYYLSIVGFAPSSGAVYELNIDDTEAPLAPLITGENFYGLGIDAEEIFVTNDNAFQGNGTVLVYGLDGSQMYNFPAGRGPNAVIAL